MSNVKNYPLGVRHSTRCTLILGEIGSILGSGAAYIGEDLFPKWNLQKIMLQGELGFCDVNDESHLFMLFGNIVLPRGRPKKECWEI